jgi:uncharacterized protein YndB with AHSA1/START domain
MNKEELVVQHSYACTAETLFDAWLDPATIRQFMCPGKDGGVGKLTWTAKVGDEFFLEMIDGGKSHPHNGRFVEITRPRRLVFTWTSAHAGKDTLVMLDFAENNGRTLLTLRHERLPSAEMIGAHRQGWTTIMTNLARTLKV